jgi:hypothetical protein
MPLALLVINPHQHLAAIDTGPTSALRTGRFLKGVYFKMQAPFMLLCGNDEKPFPHEDELHHCGSIKRLTPVFKGNLRERVRL